MDDNKTVTLGDWIITLILLAIPLVNIIMLIYWAVNATTNPSKQNYARAVIILGAVGVLLVIAIGLLGGVAGALSSSQLR